MSNRAGTALRVLRGLGSPGTLRALAEGGLAPKARPKINAHIHLPPNFSAFQTVEQAVGLAAEQGVGVLAASNYYDYAVYDDFAEQVQARNIFPLFGLEIIALDAQLLEAGVLVNDPGNPGKVYLCGKGITRFAPMSDKARRLIEIIRQNDRQRMIEMICRLGRLFAAHGLDVELNEAAIIDAVARRHGADRRRVYLQERHLAQAFQEAFFRRVPPEQRRRRLRELFGAEPQAAPDDSVAVQNEIRSHLMKAGKVAFVAESFLTFEQAHRLILELGGVPCYPTLADGTEPICAYEQPAGELIEKLKAHHIYSAEFIPIRNTPGVLGEYVRAMRAAGLVITAGTEHNTLEMLPIEPTCAGGEPIDEELHEIFWEGACVLAAHQFLTLHGECGFVDGRGRLNPAYGGDEQRIEALRRLGAAVIERYYQKHEA